MTESLLEEIDALTAGYTERHVIREADVTRNPATGLPRWADRSFLSEWNARTGHFSPGRRRLSIFSSNPLDCGFIVEIVGIPPLGDGPSVPTTVPVNQDDVVDFSLLDTAGSTRWRVVWSYLSESADSLPR